MNLKKISFARKNSMTMAPSGKVKKASSAYSESKTRRIESTEQRNYYKACMGVIFKKFYWTVLFLQSYDVN